MALALLGATPGLALAEGVILVVGDSLSSAYGMDAREGWVALLEQRLDARGAGYRVMNASISGDTTAGGVSRLPRALESHDPDVVVIELGGNDGLRGIPLEETRSNLARMVELAKAHGARVLLLGMRLPPNYGPMYTKRFHEIYADLAEANGVARVPFFLEGVGGVRELMQDDGIHPRPEAQGRLLENVWPHLEPLL
ncbi:MAG: arylesterase [Gammaproteobacteria bacterium]|nr:arylesterase [Gammaproteobacteria bacterium]